MMASRPTAMWAVLASATLFATSATAVALTDVEASGPALAAGRLIVGAAGLLILVGATAAGRQHVVRLWRQPLVWGMGIAVAGYQALFFIGVSRIGVAVGTLVSLALAPFLAGVLGWLLREGSPGIIWAVSTVLAIIGVGLLTGGDGAERDPWGVAAAMGAGAFYAIYTVLGVRLARRGIPSTTILAASFSIAALVSVPAFVMGGLWWWNPQGLLLIGWLGLVTTTLAYVLFGVGLTILQPGHIATLNLAEPVVATLLGVAVLGELLGAVGWLGCGLVVVALALLGVGSRGRTQNTARLAQEAT
ncbi:MAG: EamA family transporter [Candidatus Nanopelagicales bacterium]